MDTPLPPYPPVASTAAAQPFEPSKATMALVFAILSFFICGIFLSIPAVILARGETTAIQQGRRDPSNAGTAKAAFGVGVVNIAFQIIALVFALLMFAGVFGVSMFGREIRQELGASTGALSGDMGPARKAMLKKKTRRGFADTAQENDGDDGDGDGDTETIEDTGDDGDQE